MNKLKILSTEKVNKLLKGGWNNFGLYYNDTDGIVYRVIKKEVIIDAWKPFKKEGKCLSVYDKQDLVLEEIFKNTAPLN